MILHDHVSKTLTMLKDDENEDDVDEDEIDEEEKKRSLEKKVSGKDVIEESRQALLKTRAMSTQNLDPESVTSATSISEVVDVWLVDVYKSEYMKVADVVKDSVVKHLNRRRQQLNQEIVPRALEKAAEMMKERFEKDCRKPLEDLKLAFVQTENLEEEQKQKAAQEKKPETDNTRDRTETVIELDLNTTMVENDDFSAGGSNSVILNESDIQNQEKKVKVERNKPKRSVRFNDNMNSSSTKLSPPPSSSTIPTKNYKKDELVVTSDGVVITDQKSEVPSNFGGRQVETWHQGQKDTRQTVSKMTYADSVGSEKQPRVKRLRRSMSVPSQPMDRDTSRMILTRTPPKPKRELETIQEPSPASKMVQEQLSKVKGDDDVARTLNMGSTASLTSSSSSRSRTTTAPAPTSTKNITFKIQQPVKDLRGASSSSSSNGLSRSRESSDALDLHRNESEVTSLMDKNLKDFSLTSVSTSSMKTESRSRNTSNVSESSFSQGFMSGRVTKDFS